MRAETALHRLDGITLLGKGAAVLGSIGITFNAVDNCDEMCEKSPP